MLFFLVRNDRMLTLLLQRAGQVSGRDRASHSEALVLAAGVVAWGVTPDAAASIWKGPSIDWDGVADPGHTLLGWIVEEAPEPWEALGGVLSLPDWLAKKLWDELGPGDDGDLAFVVDLAQSLGRRAPLCLRVQGRPAQRPPLLQALALRGLAVHATPWSPVGIRVDQAIDVHSVPEIRDGSLEVQDEGSQLIAELVAAEPGSLVVDACAGGGGKTLALASWMEGTGRILACDVRDVALEQTRKRCRRAGVQSVQTVPLSESGSLPKALGAHIAGVDRLLIDAPCTGTGALRRNPQSRWHTSPLDLQRLPSLQAQILDRFAPLVAPGGRLVYATCSLLEDENDRVVAGFLERHDQFAILPVSEILGSQRAEQLGDGRVLKLYPHVHDTDGFYAVALIREA